MMYAPQMLELQAYANSKNQRLGQFLNNAIGARLQKEGKCDSDFDIGTWLFYAEDSELLEVAKEYACTV